MISELLWFLGSGAYIAHKSASSQRATTQASAISKSNGLNIPRQMHVERLAVGATPRDRQEFIELLENADLSKTTMCSTHKAKQKELLEKYGKFETWSKLNKSIRSFENMIFPRDKEYAVWIIAQSEGWTYNKSSFSELPSFCYGYQASKDTSLHRAIRKI